MRPPVALLWRHAKAEPIGLSRQTVARQRRLGSEFQWRRPFAQNAADRAAARLVAPRISVRYDSIWSCYDPDDWNPHDGRLDLCRHVHATVEEVSPTPNPQLPTRILSVR
jgi:hypothetical protein